MGVNSTWSWLRGLRAEAHPTIKFISRELPAATDDQSRRAELGMGEETPSEDERPSEALPDAEITPSEVHQPGEALAASETTHPKPTLPGKALAGSAGVTAAHDVGTRATAHHPGQQTVVTHPSLTDVECPACKLVYTTHNSLVHHVGTSHKRLTMNISYKCALCDYSHVNLRSTSGHFRLTHEAAVPPTDIEGAMEKTCPFCPWTFPSARSCSTHICEKHMKEASAQRAKEAAEKEVQRGTSTARTKWGVGEIERFKEALKKLGTEATQS